MSQKIFRKLTHDRLYKLNMHNLNVAKDTLKELLPPNYLEKIDLTSLALYPTEHIHAFSQKQTLADVVYSVDLKNSNPGLVYLHIEAQSSPDPIMPLRMLEMMVALQRQHWENNHQRLPLPLVLPMIIYSGRGRYSLSTNWLDCFDPSQHSLMVDILTTPMPLTNLSAIPDSELTRHTRAALMYYAYKHIHDKGWEDVINGSVAMLHQLRIEHHLDENELFKLFEFVLRYLADNSENVPAIEGVESSLAGLAASLPGPLGETIMTVREVYISEGVQRGMQQGMQKGIQQGVQRGIREGVQLESRRVAQVLLRRGLSDELIVDATGLNTFELTQLKQEIGLDKTVN